MRKEYIEYLKDLPINIKLANIIEYPIHWQDAIEILFVLKGSIRIGVETEVYTLNERDIEIINSNEVYWIQSDDPENLVLILNIHPNFFERYYDDAKDVFFYTNSSEGHSQEGESYRKLREFISILYYEAISGLDDYEDKIEEQLLEMMYHLLNNFHYLFYEGENLKEDEVQLERYHRIVKYLSNNYMDRISLQDLAEKEFLSSQYLSFKIKDVFGHGFNEFLNQIRVEESTKLLLDTDKNITEISEEVGFSHVRYYNKHFKLHYKLTPTEYRKKYKTDEEELEKSKNITYYDIKEALPYLIRYVEDYERYDYDNRIIKLDLDLSIEGREAFKGPNIIDLGDIYLLLEEENRRILEEIQREIGFSYCLVNRLFSEDMDIYRDKTNRFINWTRVENILETLDDLELTPIINIKGVEDYIIEDFINYFSNIYEDMDKWLKNTDEEVSPYYLKKEIFENQDTLAMVPYILYNYVHLEKKVVLNMIDEISKDIILSNDTFFGGNGIYTANYLKKPSYYGYMLLSLLGDKIVEKGDGYICTESEDGYQILFWNPIFIEEEHIYNESPMGKIKERKISLNLLNMEGDFQITRYDLNKGFGSVYDKWTFLGSPERLSNEHWELLKEFVHPNISFYNGKKSTVYNTVFKVKPNGAVLLLLNNVPNE